MKNKKYKEYYTRKIMNDNININSYNKICTKFKNEFNLEFKLTQKDINDIKYFNNSKYSKLDF